MALAISSRRITSTAVLALCLALGGCGGASDAERSDEINADSVDGPQFNLDNESGPSGSHAGRSGQAAPPLTLASGPDVCFRKIAETFGPDLNVSEITSFFSAGEAIEGHSVPPRGEMTSCSVEFQSPSDPRKLMRASYNRQDGKFGAPEPMEITVMGGNAANFRLSDYVVPLSKVNAAALTGVMAGQEKRLKAVYGDYAWSGIRLSSPGAFDSKHTLRLDLDGRIAANDIKGSGYASVSLDGKRITADHLMP